MFSVMRAHCYSEKHTKKKAVACADCGKIFNGASLGGIHYHRFELYFIIIKCSYHAYL
jgi:hypothetical protein